MPLDFIRLRNLIETRIHALSQSRRHKELPGICRTLGLPPPPGEESKADRMAAVIADAPDTELAGIALRLLEFYPPSPAERNVLQELLWHDNGSPRIPKRFRRELAERLAPDDVVIDAGRFESLLDRLWVLDSDPFASFVTPDDSLRARICRHVFRNPGDWTIADLFELLGAFDCSDHRFKLFIEGLSSAEVLLSEAAQRRFAATVSDALAQCGLELREVSEEEGYPVFRVAAKSGATPGRPKNLIFASPVKPDLRFRDAINNDIEIVGNQSSVLVYDRQIGPDGLCWNDLQQWWADANGITEVVEAKHGLYRRLKDSLPVDSPPQQRFFLAYFKAFGARIPRLPALLPEVWLHWDPKTAKERGPEALARFRMDFLLLLPGGRRVVAEIDGKQHYSEGDRASPTKYAQMVAADRDLRLAGYEVYRFGGAELTESMTEGIVRDFFTQLFKICGVEST